MYSHANLQQYLYIGASCKKGKDILSDRIALLPFGTVVTVEEIYGRRVKISKPYKGWCSLYSSDGHIILQKSNIGSKAEMERERQEKVLICKSITALNDVTATQMLEKVNWSLHDVIEAFNIEELINNHKTKLFNNINYETNKIITSMSLKEINKLKEAINVYDVKQEVFLLKWKHIINYINHFMWDKLSSIIKAIIDNNDNNININDKINFESIKIIKNELSTKRNLDKEIIQYIDILIEKAKSVIPILTNRHKGLCVMFSSLIVQ